ncbi:MAG: helix-turn-helix transcriptional regulator [Solirubrobacteraceae bacterium]|nr:helix-turn-helix transcriptional regulator [Solirubrobacteraceae bacterium]
MTAVDDTDDPGCCCPRYHSAVELIGRRWSGAIIAVLLDDGPHRFSALRARVPGVSDRVLSQRMKELEAEQVVVRTVHAGPPVRVEYELTAKGRALRPAVDALSRWGRQWLDGPGAAAEDRDVVSGAPGVASPSSTAPAVGAGGPDGRSATVDGSIP